MAERKLTAKLDAVSNISETLEDISEKATSAASSFEVLGGSASDLGDEMEDTEDDAESLSERLSDVTQAATSAMGALEGLETQTDEAGDEALESAAEFSALNASMMALSDNNIPMPDGGAISRTVETETDGLPSMGTIDRTISQSVNRSIEVDVESDDVSIFDKLRNKSPSISLETLGISRAEAEAEELNDELSRTTRLATAASGALLALGAITLGDRSSLPSPGSGDFNLPEFGDRDRSFGLPGLPDIDFSRYSRGFGSIARKGGKALSVVGELGKGLAQVAGVSKNIAGLSRIASVFGSIGSLGGIVGSLAGIAVAFGLVGASITSVVGAIGGLITGVGGLAASLAGLVGVGLFQKGKQFNAKNPLKGIGEYLKTFQDDVKKALQPIFSLPAGGFVEGFLEGGIKTLRQYSEMVKQLWPDISGMFDRLGEAFSANSPEFFAQLEKTIRAFLPMIEGFIGWFIKAAPTALKTMRKIGVKLIPKIARMFGSLWGMIEPLLPSGTALVSILVDLVTVFAEILTPINEIAAIALNPILMALAWGMDKLADVTKWASDGLSDFMDGINKWIDGIWQAMKDISLLEFGKILWNATIQAFEDTTNAVLAGLNGMINAVLDLIKDLPGGKTALKQLGLADGLTAAKVDFSDMMKDVNTGVDGMQTAASAATEPGSDLQSKGDKNKQDEGGDVYNIGPINADGSTNEAIIRQAIRRGVEDAKDESRNRTGGY